MFSVLSTLEHYMRCNTLRQIAWDRIRHPILRCSLAQSLVLEEIAGYNECEVAVHIYACKSVVDSCYRLEAPPSNQQLNDMWWERWRMVANRSPWFNSHLCNIMRTRFA